MESKTETIITLTVIDGHQSGRIFEFIDQDNFLIGRNGKGSNAHFKLDSADGFVSRNHFLMEINPPDCFLRDVGSLNGTFIIRKAEKIVFLIKGRNDNPDLDEILKSTLQEYECESYQVLDDRIKIQDGDIIRVGKTFLEVKIKQKCNDDEQKHLIISESLKSESAFHCMYCGKDISSEILEKEAEKLNSSDFVCKECQQKRDKKDITKEKIFCFGQCGMNLTDSANSDGKAGELDDVALYYCADCANSIMRDGKPLFKIDDYSIIYELGSGGFGVVYLAWHEPTGRIAALKLSNETVKKSDELIRRFKREIAIIKGLEHPALVRLYDEGISKDNLYFASEYMTNKSLADLHQDQYKGKIPYQKACSFICQALAGLSYFHNSPGKYVHRDMKLENILLTKNKEGQLVAKVADFGLSRSYILHGGTISRIGEWAGTVIYCPPEQITDFRNAKPYTDIYSVGICLYFLITGEFPYDFPTREKYFEMISKGQKPRSPVSFILGDDKPIPIEKKMPEIPGHLADAINKAIEKDYSKRFDSTEEFRKELEEYSI